MSACIAIPPVFFFFRFFYHTINTFILHDLSLIHIFGDFSVIKRGCGMGGDVEEDYRIDAEKDIVYEFTIE